MNEAFYRPGEVAISKRGGDCQQIERATQTGQPADVVVPMMWKVKNLLLSQLVRKSGVELKPVGGPS